MKGFIPFLRLLGFFYWSVAAPSVASPLRDQAPSRVLSDGSTTSRPWWRESDTAAAAAAAVLSHIWAP